ncbi:MAG TPA: exodeoxyribonuclease V subunit gamma [Solirubrobacteraceae bacterium]|nr:exodeoxyribonuclease V subunit gamma [Solirubrobacteraceae bacterium]
MTDSSLSPVNAHPFDPAKRLTGAPMLLIHRAERADILAQALAELLADVPADPLATEVVAVPTRGIERWLTQRLSTRLGSRPHANDGVCANVDFPFPGTLIAQSLALASGIAPERDPWQPARLVWPLIEVVEAALEEPWLEPLARHLLSGRQQRYARLAHIARLFDEYGVRRPELILAWARGESGGVDERAAAGWQPELWRRLREALDVPSPAERLAPACAALEANPELLSLPPRLALFGVTRLPQSHLRVLRALGAGREVHLMLLHPSPAMWAKDKAQNRLLDSWGRDVHGLQRLVLGSGEDVHHPLPEQDAAATLLGSLQADIRADVQPPGPPLRPGQTDARIELTAADRSLRIHACHGRARQVEVLREAILHRLADDPTLEPRDVIVMCPDIEAFAPLIEAAFGGGATDDTGEPAERAPGEPPTLRVRLADRSLRRTTPILAVVARLLELASARVTASEVLDLADAAPVRARFSFDDDELAQIREWVALAHIHWGLDAEGRAAYKLTEVDAGTWAAGLKRLMLGVAMDADAGAAFGGVLPAAAIQSSQIELAGRFSEFVDRLDAALRALGGPQSLAGWAAALIAAADGLAATPAHESWQRRQLDAILAEIVDEQGVAQGPEGAGQRTGTTGNINLYLGELRELLGHRLEGRPTRANFRSGHLTFCTLVPMRSVPHRLVCLLGLDDGAFPRQSPRDGDNLLLDDRRPGDRDPRTEDRQLLLDALLAAEEGLIITYSGNDERTNAPLPPAVPVGELLDAIDATARIAADSERRARELVVVRHPLQPFDPRNFTAQSSDPGRAADGPWSFDRAALAGARAFIAPRHDPEPFLPEPLAPTSGERVVTLEELVSFVQRPVRAFLRQRLGVSVRRDEDEIDDAMPIELDGLARWGVGQRLLDAVRAGIDPRDAYRAEIARGTLPPGALGAPVIQSILPTAKLLADTADALASGHQPRSEQTNVTLPDGTRLTGTVGGIHGHLMLAVSYSRLGPRQRLAAWVRLLALSAAHPEIAFEGMTIGRGGRQDPVQIRRIPQLGAVPETRRSTALTELGRLVELRAEGLRAPLPLPCVTANAYAEALQSGEDAVAAAMRKWRSGWYNDRLIEGEEVEPEHLLALGSELDLERLAELATAIWQPLLARELVGA